MHRKPQVRLSLGVSFFASIAIHVLIVWAVLILFSPTEEKLLGSILGSKKTGIEIYLRQENVFGGALDKYLTESKKLLTSESGELASLLSNEANNSSGNGYAESKNKFGTTLNQWGLSSMPTNMNTPSGRVSGFFGTPMPSGDPMGKLPIQFEWAMRRQTILSMLNSQIDFMRSNFSTEAGISCSVELSKGSCNHPDQRIIGFLSARYAELHLMDPSLKSISFISHGDGYWTYEVSD